jgi:lipopolysaccharide/colanic/teichoic acid biosynthesis glycosyltransferase
MGVLLLSPVFIVLTICGFFDTGSPFFFQERVGKDKKPFRLMKYRSMHLNTASVATHLASESAVTKYGKVLRRTKLDELPQLFNVLFGHMSLVGPRPNLFNQTELIELRDHMGIYAVRPGITGLAQISKIDMSTPKELAETDARMLQNFNTWHYFRFILLTFIGKGSGDPIKNDFKVQ